MIDISKLAQGFSGRIVRPADTDYEALRTVMYGGIDRRPAALARVANANDVARVVNFARETGAPLAIRSGGHSANGYSTVDGGIVIDLRDMKTIELDEGARTIWADAGLTAGEVSAATTAKGLVVGFGDAGSVGIGGITTGGGVGYLARKHGLTIDSLLAAEVVTADGKVHLVDAQNEPDLFWAIRGGGGNFGVVTKFKFALQPLPEFTGGMMALPATPESIAGFMDASLNAPETLGGIGNVMPAPPVPFLPAEVHGKPIIFAMLAYAGPAAEAERALAPIRALKPLADMVKPGPYMSIYPPEDPNYHPTAVSKTLFMDRVGTNEGAVILEHINASDAAMRVVQLRPLGGASARIASDATAYAHRDAPIMVNVASFYVGEADRPRRAKWVADLAAALRQGREGGYVNFVNEEGPDAVRAAYPEPTYRRLQAIKRRYDPSNLFRLNQNVVPS
jgi:FAD/FMN-containing dehydrogenase